MMSKGYARIITDGITSILNSMDPSVIDSMQGNQPRKSQPEKKSLSKFTNLASISDHNAKILKAVLQSKFNGLSGKFHKDGQLERGLPTSWTMPVSGKKLRIGVPMKEGFTKLVKVDRDPQTVHPFDNSNGSGKVTSGDLVFQVYLRNVESMMSLRAQQVGMIFWYSFSTLVFSQSK
ncbi:hypothetical protein AAG906_020333 [Vitis piasezkii]